MRVLDEAFWLSPITRRERRIVTITTLFVMSVLILARLGAAALWDDEANTALFGEAVWDTGGLTAVRDHNIVAFRNGFELDETLTNRWIVPLSYYLEAIFVRDTGSAWWARLPFALAGIATLVLLLRWLGESAATRRTWALYVLAMLGNVSFVLFSRQARYYALMLILATGIAYCYAHRDRARQLSLGAGLAVALLATHYLAYAGVAVMLAFDYVLWGRKDKPLSGRAIAAVCVVQLLAALVIVSIWNPLGKEMAPPSEGSWLGNKILLWLAMLRDVNTCEFGVGIVMLAAPFLYKRDRLAVRWLLGVMVSITTVTLLSPQPIVTALGDVRYVAYLLPACAVIAVRVFDALPLRTLPVLALALVAFHTTALHRVFASWVPAHEYQMPLRSTTLAYVGELIDPPPSSYALAATWLDANARDGDTAITFPDFALYPLMFHAPKLVYAWQFTAERAASWHLAPIHAAGVVAPDWIVSFPGVRMATLRLTGGRIATYEKVTELPVSGVDATRPELYWHHFAAQSSPYRLGIWRRVDATP